MGLQLKCSPEIEKKLNKLLKTNGICVDDNSSYCLVEKGYPLPSGKICVVFEGIDYIEAVDLLKGSQEITHPANESNMGLETQGMITGFFKDRYVLIKPEEILYIESNKAEISCITSDKTYILKKQLYYYEELLRTNNIIKVNKSQIVNLLNVTEIIPWFNSRLVLVMKNDERIEVSKLYAKVLRKTLDL